MSRITGTPPPARSGGVKMSGLEVELDACRPTASLRRRKTSCALGCVLREGLDASERGDDVAGRTGDEGIAERTAVELVPDIGEGFGAAGEDPDCDFRKDSNSRFTELDRPADAGGLTRRVGAAEVRPGVAVDDLEDGAFGRDVLDGCVADERVEERSRLRSALDEPLAREADGECVGLLGILMLAGERELEPEEWLTMGGRLVRETDEDRDGVCVERLGIRKPADEREDAPDDRAVECGLPVRAVFEREALEREDPKRELPDRDASAWAGERLWDGPRELERADLLAAELLPLDRGGAATASARKHPNDSRRAAIPIQCQFQWTCRRDMNSSPR